jgi:hypothetical protein
LETSQIRQQLIASLRIPRFKMGVKGCIAAPHEGLQIWAAAGHENDVEIIKQIEVAHAALPRFANRAESVMKARAIRFAAAYMRGIQGWHRQIMPDAACARI